MTPTAAPSTATSPPVSVLVVGQTTLDQIFEIEHSLRPGHKQVATAHAAVVGGVGANAALAAVRAGGRTTLVSTVGDDEAGRAVLATLRDDGIDVDVMGRAPRTATSAVVVSTDGERTIVNHTPAEIWSAEPPEMESLRPDAVLVDPRWRPGARSALRLANDRNLPAVVDLDLGASLGDHDLRRATHLVCSADGLMSFTRLDDTEAALRAAVQRTGSIVVVTRGAEGLTWLEHDDVHELPAFPVAPVDTTGAGDVFHGALALVLAEGQPLDEALRFASAAAAIKCTRAGGGRGAPWRHEVDELLADADRSTT